MAKETTEKKMYRATKDKLPTFIAHDGSANLLELQGVFLDRLHSVGCAFPRLTTEPTTSSESRHIVSLTETLLSWNRVANSGFPLSNTTDNGAARASYYIAFECTLLADLSHPTFDFTLPSAPLRPAPIENLEVRFCCRA